MWHIHLHLYLCLAKFLLFLLDSSKFFCIAGHNSLINHYELYTKLDTRVLKSLLIIKELVVLSEQITLWIEPVSILLIVVTELCLDEFELLWQILSRYVCSIVLQHSGCHLLIKRNIPVTAIVLKLHVLLCWIILISLWFDCTTSDINSSLNKLWHLPEWLIPVSLSQSNVIALFIKITQLSKVYIHRRVFHLLLV